MKELNAIPEAALVLAIPGTHEEARKLQQMIPVLLADALSDFQKARSDPEAYVARGYSFLSAEEKEKKVEEVHRRREAARLLHNVVLRLQVELL